MVRDREEEPTGGTTASRDVEMAEATAGMGDACTAGPDASGSTFSRKAEDAGAHSSTVAAVDDVEPKDRGMMVDRFSGDDELLADLPERPVPMIDRCYTHFFAIVLLMTMIVHVCMRQVTQTITNLVKGKNQVTEKVKEEKKEKPEKLMGDVMKSLKIEIKETKEKKREPSSSPKSPGGSKVTTAQPEKPKKKEKVKMKLSVTFCNRKDDNLLLWIAEIQTYCSTALVDPESQVAFSTSCLGGEAKERVLAEANAAGFDDIGEWVGTLNLKQFLSKIKERFLDKTTTDKAFDQRTTIGQKHGTSVESFFREVDRLLQVRGLNLQDNQVLYIYSRALPEPIRGQLVAESKSDKYNYRQFRDMALQREQMTSQVKNSYASVVKFGGGAGVGKRILWRQKRQDHTLVVFDDDIVEKWSLKAEGVASSSDSGKGEVTAAVVNKGGPRPPVMKKKKPRSFLEYPGIVAAKPWEKMGISQEIWREWMDNV
ncbi:hypothetical protein CBR_g54853 [Chara braunii]|uniref:Retrotransposon gag domain-containing protein n=1 Tax=Chara braunii TaxID=69332 RepID=A0A388JPN3_CHABU|nr:hypothetical protein CBR_g54853 [Chara braunii]|eukprot:GBG59750.1 hypothetical protein CBR_g54853 [Chara braunii]